MNFKDINIELNGMHRDNNREIFVYTPTIGMEVKKVISSLCEFSKSINGHTIETNINDIVIRIDEKSDDKKVYQNYLKDIAQRHKNVQITSAQHPYKTPNKSHNFE
ncbi:MAG: hypothetical protein IKY98_05155 [Alphaproteobacteria bacterium]|nr:hypothetical protein [Alphaproteobacteria bacterium]